MIDNTIEITDIAKLLLYIYCSITLLIGLGAYWRSIDNAEKGKIPFKPFTYILYLIILAPFSIPIIMGYRKL